MPPNEMPEKPATTKDQETQASSGTRKTTSSTTRPAPEQGLKCPRCDSPNTKFCYYNNYSLTQPRHFCKTCRRYWTNGGALRNVPIGGGCRKNKKLKSSSSSSSRLSCDSKDSGSSSELGGLRFLQGLSPSVEFQLGGLPFPSRLHNHHPPTPTPIPTTGVYNQFSSFGDVSATTSALSGFQLDPSNSLIGLNYPLSSSSTGSGGFNGAMNVHSSLASSIESLSNINHDLHLKLQQQRLAMMFGGDSQKGDSNVSLSAPVNSLENQTPKLQPGLFPNLEISKPETLPAGNSIREDSSHGETQTEWFFGNSYSSVLTPTTTTHSLHNVNVDVNANGNNGNNNWNSVHAWGDLQQPYSALP